MEEFINLLCIDMAVAAYNKFNENLIGCCENTWNEMPLDFRQRMIDAQKEALKAGIKSFADNICDLVK